MWLQMFSYAISYYKYVQQLLLKPPWSNTVMEKWRVYLNLTIQKMLTTSTLHFQNLVPNLRSLESKFSQNDSKVEHSPFQRDLCRELSIESNPTSHLPTLHFTYSKQLHLTLRPPCTTTNSPKKKNLHHKNCEQTERPQLRKRKRKYYLYVVGMFVFSVGRTKTLDAEAKSIG